MGGHVSGAHYNPAVSLAVMIRGKLGLMEFICYVASQVAGAIVAAYNAAFIRGDVPALQPGAAFTIQQALLVESLFTFALALVVLNAATAKKTEGNSFYGLAIGFTITAAAFAGGPVSGGAFNPAVGIGITLAHGSLPQLWIYLVGPLVGGAAAAVVFRVQEKGTVS
jgi:aquaporin Z